ncbi:MAG TPA: FtsQ-type POTRA domain-containing protein [Candidatus Eremiobacteraceae bacterium]|jgi:cell division septal protein FtsQ|nr:FtsQ-type POTRA domain-containing protein [Candidatus Eremiobacteraceae bacterium]
MNRPEQVRRQAARRTVLGRQALLLAACLLAGIATGFGLWHESSNPRFAVEIVAIRGLAHTAYPDVVTAAELSPGQNAWLINRGAVARRIEALPWVGRAALHISWPNRLTINVIERVPVARVVLAPQSGAEEPVPRYAAIDETQRVLSVSEDPKVMGQLPVLVVTPPPSGDVAPGGEFGRREVGQALDAYRRLSGLGLTISEVAIAPSTGISATADRNLRVLFGEDEDLAAKAQLFHSIVAKISTPSRIAYVDVRSIHAPTVLYR